MKLAHSFVGQLEAPRLAFVLHGVLGAGHNFRGFMRKLSVARPDYRFVLVDLRYHNDSTPGPEETQSPASMESCADDLFELCETLGATPDVVIGHSLGGKVALNFARRFTPVKQKERKATTDQRRQLHQVWALDSDPGPQLSAESHQVIQVLSALKSCTPEFASRAEALSQLTKQGLSSALSQWLATSLTREKGAGDKTFFRFKFELSKIETLLKDYFHQDLWPFLEEYKNDLSVASRGASPHLDLLLAENSDRWSGSMKERAESLQGGAHINIYTLPKSGHWVHVDNPEGLLEILNAQLP